MTLAVKNLWLGIAFFWFFAALFALAFFASVKLSAFDPEQILLNKSANLNFDADFVQAFTKHYNVTPNTVFHFSAADCDCSSVAQEHVGSVSALAESNQYKNQNITLTIDEPLAQYIPSTPAVAVVNSNGKLSYLGPYSAGYSCSVGSGIVERFIANKAGITPGATIVTDTLGCYCNLTAG